MTIKTLSTKDLHEASAVQAYSGFSPIQLDVVDGVIWFVFEGRTDLDEISNLYWNGQLTVSARSMSEALHSLKRRLFAKRNNEANK